MVKPRLTANRTVETHQSSIVSHPQDPGVVNNNVDLMRPINTRSIHFVCAFDPNSRAAKEPRGMLKPRTPALFGLTFPPCSFDDSDLFSFILEIHGMCISFMLSTLNLTSPYRSSSEASRGVDRMNAETLCLWIWRRGETFDENNLELCGDVIVHDCDCLGLHLVEEYSLVVNSSSIKRSWVVMG